MSLMEIAGRAGVTLDDMESLIQGNIPVAIADRLEVPILGLQEFVVRGETSAKVAHRLGLSMAAAGELAQTLGAEGRTGVILGLLLSSGRSRAAEVGR